MFIIQGVWKNAFFKTKKKLQKLQRLFLLFVLCHFIAFRAVFFNIHAIRMFFLIPGADIVFVTTLRAFESDTVSHCLTSSLFT